MPFDFDPSLYGHLPLAENAGSGLEVIRRKMTRIWQRAGAGPFHEVT
jgi:hypothetical protein